MQRFKLVHLICILAIFISIVTFIAKANTYSPKSIKIINEIGDTRAFPSALDGITKNETDDVINFMEQHPEKVIPWYYATMSDYIYKYKKDEKKALQFYYRGLIRVQEDVKMCKDPYAKQFKNSIDNEIEETQILKIKYAIKNPWNLYILYEKELSWDEKTKRYRNPLWVCTVMKSDAGSLPISEYENVLKKYRTDMRDMNMWKNLINDFEKTFKNNKEYYETLIKQL